MNHIDYIVIIGYLIGVIVIGGYIGKKQTDTSDFFLAGKSMKWWPIAISLFASLFSAISYIAMPGEAFNYGMNMYLSGFFSLLPMPIMLFVFMKLFYHLKLWTSYEYLEKRFSFAVRIFGSLSFMLMRGVYLGTVLYATALILKSALDWPLWISIIIIGLISTLYTSLGGMSAVIWTDVIQFFVLLGGILVVIFVVAYKMDGGVLGIWNYSSDMKKTFDISLDSGIYSFNFKQRITIWVWLISVIPNCISPAIDQVNLQRCLSCKSFKEVSKAIMGSTIGMLPVTFIFYFAGLALFVYFNKFYTGAKIADLNGDNAFIYFCTHVLPVGIRGLIFAAILAAVMSTVDSVVNSLTAVSIKDIYEKVVVKDKSESHYLFVSKILTWCWGVFAIIFGLLIVYIFSAKDIPLLEVSNVCLGLLGGLLLGLFALGLLTKRANSFGAIAGLTLGAILTYTITYLYYLRVDSSERMSFLWIGLIANASVFVFGYLLSFFAKKNDKDISQFVVWSKMNR